MQADHIHQVYGEEIGKQIIEELRSMAEIAPIKGQLSTMSPEQVETTLGLLKPLLKIWLGHPTGTLALHD